MQAASAWTWAARTHNSVGVRGLKEPIRNEHCGKSQDGQLPAQLNVFLHTRPKCSSELLRRRLKSPYQADP